jgi:hypothetical protein
LSQHSKKGATGSLFYIRLPRKPSCTKHWLLVKSPEFMACSDQAT